MAADFITFPTFNDAGSALFEYPLPLHNLTATTDPDVSDDDVAGYVAGSMWVNTATPELFDCEDNSTGAAVWVSRGSGGGYTDEEAQDAVGAMIDASLNYVDGTPLLQRAALTGDVTAAAGSNATTIANNAVTFAKMQAVSADILLGNDAAGTAVEEIACTAFARTILDDVDAATVLATLGAGNASSAIDFANDNRLVRTDTASGGKFVQQSGITVSDADELTGIASIVTQELIVTPGATVLSGTVSIERDITPSALTAHVNDYSPTDFLTCAIVYLSTDGGNYNITGLDSNGGAVVGMIKILHNQGTAGTITLKDDDAASSALNRFDLAADFLLGPKAACIIQYHVVDQRWHVIGSSDGGGSGGVPTTITVADTTDTTCFVGLFESATGDLAPKTDGGLTYNASTGTLTATAFSGPLTGNVTGNVSGSSGSCTGNSATVTTNANLTGEVTSSGNAAVLDKTAITNRSADASPDAATDYVLTYDASAAALKKVLLEDLPSGGGGTSIPPAAVVATTAVLPACTYANGTSGVGATLTGDANGAFPAFDGVTAGLNDYVLVKEQASGLQNGLYQLTQVGDAGTPFILTRAAEMDTTGEFVNSYVVIKGGTIGVSTIWYCANTTAPTVGTTAITFTGIRGHQSVTATANFTDNTLLRADGTSKGAQGSGVTLDDTNNMTLPGNLTIGGGASSSELCIKEPSGGGSSKVGFKAPALAADLVFTLPATDAAGVLKSDGSLGLSFQAFATQSDMESASSTTAPVVPSVVKYHPGVAKAAIKASWDGASMTINSNYNFTSATRDSQGRFSFVIDTDLSSAHWSATVSCEDDSTAGVNIGQISIKYNTMTAGAISVDIINNVGTGFVDPLSIHIHIFGDL